MTAMTSRVHGGVRMWRRDLAGRPSYRTRSERGGRYFLIFRQSGGYDIYEPGASATGSAAWRGYAGTLAEAGAFVRQRYGLSDERGGS